MLLSEWGQCHSFETDSICQHSQCIALVRCTVGHHEKAVLNFTGQAATQGEAGHVMPLCAVIPCHTTCSVGVEAISGRVFRTFLYGLVSSQLCWICIVSAFHRLVHECLPFR